MSMENSFRATENVNWSKGGDHVLCSRYIATAALMGRLSFRKQFVKDESLRLFSDDFSRTADRSQGQIETGHLFWQGVQF